MEESSIARKKEAIGNVWEYIDNLGDVEEIPPEMLEREQMQILVYMEMLQKAALETTRQYLNEYKEHKVLDRTDMEALDNLDAFTIYIQCVKAHREITNRRQLLQVEKFLVKIKEEFPEITQKNAGKFTEMLQEVMDF